jgi:hypothetical protein
MKPAFLFLFLLQVVCGYAQITKQQMAEALPGKLTHPYLFFNEAEKNNILSLIRNDKESKQIYDRLLVECNRLMYTPIEKFPPENDHPRYYSDGKFDQQIGTYSNAALSLAFLYQLTGEDRYAQKSFDFADAVAELPSWIIKAHEFSIIYDRVWPWNSLLNDDNVVFSSDIRTASTGIDMAMVYDWCYDAFNKRQRDRIRNALYEKVILPVRNNYDYQWWATSYKCNWCGICFSGLGTASLSILTEDPGLVDVIAETFNRIGNFLNNLGPDGAWQEGRSYWAYGMSETIYFMESIRKVTKGKFNLLAHERIQKAPVDFALYGLTGEFGDGNGRPVGNTSLINILAEQTSNGEGVWYRNHILKEGASIFDLIWPRPAVKESAPETASKYFRSIDWAFMRSDFLNPNAVTVACKAGYNDDPHHGHLDVGQFMVYWQNKYFIKDLGNIAYDEQYFTSDRWNYPNASSLGHNLIFVNGEQQKSAKYKDSAWEKGVGGKILEFRTSGKRDYTLMDPTKAYPGQYLKKWRRHIVLQKPDVTLLLDEISCLPGSEIEARFFPGVKNIESGENYTMLTDEEGHTLAVFPVCKEKIFIENSKLPFLPVKKEVIVEWIPYFTSKVKAVEPTTYLVTLIIPVKNGGEADRIGKSISVLQLKDETYRVFFKNQNTNYTIHFCKTPDGLVLD